MKGYSYTSTPPVGRTACTEPQCLYTGALYLPFLLPYSVCCFRLGYGIGTPETAFKDGTIN